MPRKKSSGPEAIVLPTSSDPPPTKLDAYNIIVYGEKGIGKSTLCAQFEKNLHFLWEPGRRNLKTPVIPDRSRREVPLDWVRFHDYVEPLLAKKNPKIDRLTIDSLDLCALACEQWHASQLTPPRKNLIGLQDRGEAWRGMKDDWDNVFYPLIWVGYQITFVSHARYGTRLVRGKDRKELKDEPQVCQPTCRGWAWEFARVVCDFAWCYTYHGHERILIVDGQEDVWAANGCREDHFLDKGSKEPLDALYMGASAEQSYKMLCAGFANKAEGLVFDE